jgi:exonuclease VII large subunit
VPTYLLAIALGLSLLSCAALFARVAQLTRRLKHARYLIKETKHRERRRSETRSRQFEEKLNTTIQQLNDALRNGAQALAERDEATQKCVAAIKERDAAIEQREAAEREKEELKRQRDKLLVQSVTRTANSQETESPKQARSQEQPKKTKNGFRIISRVLLSILIAVIFHALDVSAKPSLTLDFPIVSTAWFVLGIVFSPTETSS